MSPLGPELPKQSHSAVLIGADGVVRNTRLLASERMAESMDYVEGSTKELPDSVKMLITMAVVEAADKPNDFGGVKLTHD